MVPEWSVALRKNLKSLCRFRSSSLPGKRTGPYSERTMSYRTDKVQKERPSVSVLMQDNPNHRCSRSTPSPTTIVGSALPRDMNLDPWELINFNFPGIKALYQSAPKLAYRNVYWDLRNTLLVKCLTIRTISLFPRA